MTRSDLTLSAFFPAGSGVVEAPIGFRHGAKGTHSSRTLMLSELSAVLADAPGPVDRAAYPAAIIEGNCLQKPTGSTRRLSAQRLSELYALDPAVPVFRVLRNLWSLDEAARPQLALLAAVARDPLLAASVPPVLSLPVGAQLQRAPLRNALRTLVGERMNDSTLDKVARNVSSTWTQTGHLRGRTFKFRTQVQARPTAMAFALWMGEAAGFRGEDLFRTGWVALLDCSPSAARTLALDAKRLGVIDLRISGDVVELGFDRLDPSQGRG